MNLDDRNRLGMVPDPYAGDTFVLSETLCSDERRLWFRRSNEIVGFLNVTELALDDSRLRYAKLMKQDKLKPDTPLKIAFSDGRSMILPVHTFLKQCEGAVDILCRQVFVMLYGSLETFLFDLIERSFRQIGVTEDILDPSLDIMMRRKWDGKLCKLRDVFELPYEASNMIKHFEGFQMEFEGKSFKNPLIFLDELAQVRHKIVHASSILEEGKLIFVNAQVFHAYYGFCALLTDYIDGLFAAKFAYARVKINPAEA
ncbi:MAG: hypothetical protein ABSC55_12465 [Syntrophorhabdales bacterium]